MNDLAQIVFRPVSLDDAPSLVHLCIKVCSRQRCVDVQVNILDSLFDQKVESMFNIFGSVLVLANDHAHQWTNASPIQTVKKLRVGVRLVKALSPLRHLD